MKQIINPRRFQMHFGKKRLLIGASAVTAVGAAATLVSGVTFGLFSATTPSETESFSAGTVTLNKSVTHICTVSHQVPGDSSSGWNTANSAPAGQTDTPGTTCSFTVTYGGSEPAFLGLDLAVKGTSATPQVPYSTATTTYVNGASTPSALSVTPNVTSAAGTVTVTAAGFSPAGPVTVKLGGTTMAFSQANVDGSGNVSGTFTVPASTAPGAYSVSVSDGSGDSATSPVNVVVGAPGLYDGSANGLQLLLKDDNGTTYNSGGSWSESSLNGATPASNATAAVNDILVSKDATTLAHSESVTVTVDWKMPNTSSNAYQNAASSLTMTVHAVQAGNNGDASSCSLGQVCPGITSWS